MPDSNITKHAIAAALKELCREKSFDKISIADITSTCGLNRQTFYYHFEDKYELLNWIYYTEGFARLVDGITLENWDSHIAVLFETMRADKKFYENTVRCTPDTFGNYLFKVVRALFLEAVEALDNDTVPDADRLLCLRKLRNSQSLGVCRYENAAGGAGPQPKTACTGQ